MLKDTIWPISSSMISADSGDIRGAEAARPAEGTDDTQSADERTDSGTGEEKKCQTEKEEKELSGQSTESSHHGTSAEQSRERSGLRKKPSARQRSQQVRSFRFVYTCFSVCLSLTPPPPASRPHT